MLGHILCHILVMDSNAYVRFGGIVRLTGRVSALSLTASYVPSGLNHPNEGINQELPDKGPQEITACYEMRYGRAELMVQGNKVRTRGALQQHDIAELS